MEPQALSQATVLAGILIANAATILGTFISMREKIAVLQVKVDRLELDINNVGEMLRENKKQIEES